MGIWQFKMDSSRTQNWESESVVVSFHSHLFEDYLPVIKIVLFGYKWDKLCILMLFRFAGPMERLQAEAELINRVNSTYLVRHRSREYTEYAISIK